MRLRLIALSAITLALLLIALAPLVSTTQAQQPSNRSANDNAAPGTSFDTPGGAYHNLVTRDYPGNALSQFWSPTTFPILGLEPMATTTENDKALCWKRTYTRGVGIVPTGDCPAGQEKDAGLCYPKCRDGFKGVGPVCWKSCPDKFRDDGAFCAKPEAYGRGAGYPWKFGDPAFNLSNARARCEADNGGAGTCEQDGAIWYPKCKAGFVKVGCCVCSPACPAGMTDIGVSCAKESYGRGVGTSPGCGAGYELDGGLCYPVAAQGFKGVGPVAWGKCPAEFPFECGAGCAKNQAACATAVTDMTLNTIGVAINLLSFPFGGPGVTAAAQKAVTKMSNVTSMHFVHASFKEVMKRTATFTVSAMRLNAKAFAKEFVKAYAKSQVTNKTNLAWNGASLLKTGGLFAANQAARGFGGMKTSGDFDWTMLTALDPTGIASMVNAFAKYGNCSGESFLADVNELDFGAVTTPVSGEKIVNLSMQQPTTITEITTTPFTNAAISADADCVGKLLQTGQKCALKVRVSGAGKIEGAVQIYTTDYDVIPFVVEVKANPNAAPATPVTGVDDAVNLTAVTGIWAWGKNQSQKVTVLSNGTATSWAGNKGVVTVKDPIKRVYEFNWDGGRNIDTLTLTEDRQELSGQNQARAAVSAVRRPWDERCKPGEEFFAGLCYDVPPDYAPTAPGFMGKPCPLGWRDDGTSCWPNWTGVDVAAQAAQTGTFRHPLLVTDCNNYSQAKGQKCPTNFSGPTACTCAAQPKSKEVKSIIGTVPVK
jgi:hypothetical protein